MKRDRARCQFIIKRSSEKVASFFRKGRKGMLSRTVNTYALDIKTVLLLLLRWLLLSSVMPIASPFCENLLPLSKRNHKLHVTELRRAHRCL